MDKPLSLLKNVPIFADLTNDELAVMSRLLSEEPHKAKDVIFREGEPGDIMYLVAEGQVAITKKAGKARKGLAALGPGAAFGEFSLFDGGTRSANAVATADSRLFVLKGSDLYAIFAANPVLGQKILLRVIQELTRRFRKTNQDVADWVIWAAPPEG